MVKLSVNFLSYSISRHPTQLCVSIIVVTVWGRTRRTPCRPSRRWVGGKRWLWTRDTSPGGLWPVWSLPVVDAAHTLPLFLAQALHLHLHLHLLHHDLHLNPKIYTHAVGVYAFRRRIHICKLDSSCKIWCRFCLRKFSSVTWIITCLLTMPAAVKPFTVSFLPLSYIAFGVRLMLLLSTFKMPFLMNDWRCKMKMIWF